MYTPDRELNPPYCYDKTPEVIVFECECCFEETKELYTVRVPFRNIVKKEYYCLDCTNFFNSHPNG